MDYLSVWLADGVSTSLVSFTHQGSDCLHAPTRDSSVTHRSADSPLQVSSKDMFQFFFSDEASDFLYNFHTARGDQGRILPLRFKLLFLLTSDCKNLFCCK